MPRKKFMALPLNTPVLQLSRIRKWMCEGSTGPLSPEFIISIKMNDTGLSYRLRRLNSGCSNVHPESDIIELKDFRTAISDISAEIEQDGLLGLDRIESLFEPTIEKWKAYLQGR